MQQPIASSCMIQYTCMYVLCYSTRIKKVNVLLAYYTYGYGRTTLMAMGVLRLRLRAYDTYGYGHTTLTTTGVLCLRLRAYDAYGCGHTTLTATSVLGLSLVVCQLS